jgi:glycosyltransferase involved in cell wall biosynthesis
MKKNIAIIIPQLAGGGAERVASNLSLYLPEDKYKKHIIVYDTEKMDYPYKGELLSINTKVSRNPLSKIKNYCTRIYKLKKIKRDYKIDISISLLTRTNIANILTKGNDKVIVSVRNYLTKSSTGFYGRINNILIKLLYNKADHVVAVSNIIKTDLVENFGINENKIQVIYNPYDIEKINRLAQEEIEEEFQEIFKCPTIITAGRLTKQKGQWHLIRSFKNVKKEIPNAKLVIIGQGELEDYLKQLAVDLNLEKDIHFLGFRQNPFKYISRSKVYSFPSLYEGFPNTLCEAMICGVPVISSDCKSGPKEILSPDSDINKEVANLTYCKYGILVPVCEEELISSKVELTINEKVLAESTIKLIKDIEISKMYSSLSVRRSNDFSYKKIISEWNRLL